jgi:hypothetical protein
MDTICKAVFSLVSILSVTTLNYRPDLIQDGQALLAAKDSIYAYYINTAPGGLALESITFKKNHTFTYLSGNDIQQISTKGTWKKIKDTFIVNSFVQRNNLPISIREFNDAASDTLIFDWVKNPNGDIMKGASIFINGDTTKGYMPVLDECRFVKGTVKKIRLTFDNSTSSKWYYLENRNAARVAVTINVNEPLVEYIFFHQMKFLVRQDRLYRLNEIKDMENVRSSGDYIRDENYYLTKKQ